MLLEAAYWGCGANDVWGESSGLDRSACGGMEMAVLSMRTCFFVRGGGETAGTGTGTV